MWGVGLGQLVWNDLRAIGGAVVARLRVPSRPCCLKEIVSFRPEVAEGWKVGYRSVKVWFE